MIGISPDEWRARRRRDGAGPHPSHHVSPSHFDPHHYATKPARCTGPEIENRILQILANGLPYTKAELARILKISYTSATINCARLKAAKLIQSAGKLGFKIVPVETSCTDRACPYPSGASL